MDRPHWSDGSYWQNRAYWLDGLDGLDGPDWHNGFNRPYWFCGSRRCRRPHGTYWSYRRNRLDRDYWLDWLDGIYGLDRTSRRCWSIWGTRRYRPSRKCWDCDKYGGNRANRCSWSKRYFRRANNVFGYFWRIGANHRRINNNTT